MAKTYNDAGKASIVFKGDYDSETNYEILDAVSANGGSYISIKNDNIGNDLNDETAWLMLTKGIKEIRPGEIEYTDGSIFELNIPQGGQGGSGIARETDPTVPSYVKSITEQQISDWNQNKTDITSLTSRVNSLEENGVGEGGTGITEETDPTVPSYVKSIKEADITKWNKNNTDISTLNSKVDSLVAALGENSGLENFDIEALGKNICFNDVASMKADEKVSEGTCLKTLGFFDANDGGGAYYITRLKTEEDVTDDATIIELQNDLVAELVIQNNTVDIRQLGYKANVITQDCKNSIQQYVNLCNRDNNKYKLYIPSGIWCFSETDLYNDKHVRNGVWIEGTAHNYGDFSDTIISPLNNNQNYIWNLGMSEESTTIVGGNILHNLRFTTEFAERYVADYGRKLCKNALLLTYCCYSHFDSLYFQQVCGTGLTIRNCFENYFGFMNFRGVGFITHDKTYHPLVLGKHPVANMPSGISADYFDYINFEGWCGSAIYCEAGNPGVHSEFNNIQVEWNNAQGYIEDGYTLTWTQDADTEGITWDNESENIEHMYIVKGNFGAYYNGMQINTISASGCNRELYTVRDSEGNVVRYLVRSGVFGTLEHYEEAGGLNVVCSKLSMAGRTFAFPAFHSLNLLNPTRRGTQCRIGVLQSCNKPFWIKQNGVNCYFTVSKELDKYNDNDKIYFANKMGSNLSLTSLGDGSGLNNLVYRGGTGSITFNYDASKSLYVRMYVDCDTVDELPDNIRTSYVITRKDGTYKRGYSVDIPKSDFEDNKYPLKEWFDFCISDCDPRFYPFDDVQYEFASANPLYLFDYLYCTNKLREIKTNHLKLSEITNYSRKGAMAYCTDKRKTAEDDLGITVMFDGTIWRSLDGTPLDNIGQSSSSGITEESDPTVPSYVKNITEQQISDWNQNKTDITSLTTRVNSLEENGVGESGITEETDPTVPAYVKNIKETDITKWNQNSTDIEDLNSRVDSIDVNSYMTKSNIITVTQAEYDALETKDPDTFYFIEEE